MCTYLENAAESYEVRNLVAAAELPVIWGMLLCVRVSRAVPPALVDAVEAAKSRAEYAGWVGWAVGMSGPKHRGQEIW
jgi:hypothetical protein